MRRLRILSVVVLVWIFAIMMLGGYTKAVGAGLACPDWPKCYGTWLPPWPEDAQFTTHQIAAEWLHRAFVGSFAVPMLWLAFASFREREANQVVRYTPLVILVVLALQVVLGMLTVTKNLHAVIVTSHLGTATIIFGLSVLHAVMMYARPYTDPTRSITGTDTGGPNA